MLAFLLAGTFLVYAVLILVMRNVFVREEREGKLAPHKTAATEPGPASTADTTPAVSTPVPYAVLQQFWHAQSSLPHRPSALHTGTI